MAMRVGGWRTRRNWEANKSLDPHVQAPLTGLDFGGSSHVNGGNYYTATIPELPNADWAVVVRIRPSAGKITSSFWSLHDQMSDTSTTPGLRLTLNSGNDGATFTGIRQVGGTEQTLQTAVPYRNRSVLIVTQRRGANYEQYVCVEGGTKSAPDGSVAHDGTTIPTATWRIGSDQFSFHAPVVLGEFAVVLNDSLTAAEVTTLAAGAHIDDVATPTVDLRFRSGAVATETNLGSGGATNDATRVGTGFWLARELFPEPPATGYVGTASITFDTLTAAGTGVLSIRGTAGFTLDALTTTGAGALAISGTASVTLGDLTTGGTGALAIVGAAAVTLGDLTVAGTGALAIQGTASVTFDDLTVAGDGTLGAAGAITGTASVTFGDLTAAGTGQLAIAATAAVTLDALTVSGTGQLAAQGTAAVTLADMAAAGTGALAIQANGSITLADMTAAGTGALALRAQAALLLDDMTVTGQGSLPLIGTLSVTFQDLLVAGTGIDPNAGGGSTDELRSHSPIARPGALLAG